MPNRGCELKMRALLHVCARAQILALLEADSHLSASSAEEREEEARDDSQRPFLQRLSAWGLVRQQLMPLLWQSISTHRERVGA